MRHLIQMCDGLPLAMGELVHEVIYVIGLIGVVVIAIFLVLCLSMIPDFLRYLKIKSM